MFLTSKFQTSQIVTIRSVITFIIIINFFAKLVWKNFCTDVTFIMFIWSVYTIQSNVFKTAVRLVVSKVKNLGGTDVAVKSCGKRYWPGTV